MIIDERSTAVKISVLSFFTVAVIASISKVSCLEVSKRAMIAAIVTYFATAIVVKFINYVLITSIAEDCRKKRVQQEQEFQTE